MSQPGTAPTLSGLRKPPQFVQIDYPTAFKMPVAEAADRCGWRLRIDGGRQLVRPLESSSGTRPRLLAAERLHTNEILNSASLGTSQHWGATGQTLEGLSKLAPQLRALMTEASTTEGYLGHLRNLLSLTPEPFLPNDLSAGWTRIQTELPAASLWKVPTDSRTAVRISLINGLFAHSETPELFGESAGQSTSFEAGRAFTGRYVYGLGFLLEPFLLAASPYSLGWAASRLGGAYVVLFGEARRYLNSAPEPSLLDLSKPHAFPIWIPHLPPAPPVLSPSEIERGFLWWTFQLDQILSVLTDPRWYTDQVGRHDPILQIATMLTAAWLFTTVQAVLAEPLESHSRLGLLFDALDLLEGLRFGSYDVLCSSFRTQRLVNQLRKDLPAPVAAVLIPKCEGAVAALLAVQAGFFCHARISNGKMRVPGKHGEVAISLDDAAAQYLRLIRNSTHSFHAMATQDKRDKALYACHSGQFDARLPDLAFVHLMRIMSEPRLLVSSVAASIRPSP